MLLKAVIQAIPTYAMSIFQLPKTLSKRINSMMLRFWWRHKDSQSRIPWMGWSRMGLAKQKGGLGYRDIKCLNEAMSAKQGWCLIKHPTSLMAQILKAKYYLREGIIWRVDEGQSIKIWGDHWIPSPTTYAIQSPHCILPSDARVCTLMDEEPKWWNLPMLQELFSQEEVEKICSLIPCPGRQPDTIIWLGTQDGEFFV